MALQCVVQLGRSDDSHAVLLLVTCRCSTGLTFILWISRSDFSSGLRAVFLYKCYICVMFTTISSEDDGPADKEEVNCPICLLPFTGQNIGTPESCDHEFCLICIQEWAKVIDTFVSLTLLARCITHVFPFWFIGH